MMVGGVAAIESRMDAIDSRFGRRASTDGRLGADLIASDETATQSTRFSDVLADVTTLLDTTHLDTAHLDTAHLDTAQVLDGNVLTSEGVAVGRAPSPAGTEHGGVIAAGTPFATNFEIAGATYGVPPRLLAAVGWVESRYTVDAVSRDGALGVMQIMPATAAELGVDPTDPNQAIDGGARLLADHHRRFGSWDLALAAYHSGAGAVSRAGNTAPPRAAEYVRRVHERLERA